MLYLDCYLYGAMQGDQFPVNSYGPAPKGDIDRLAKLVGHNFDRMEVVATTKGMNPLPRYLWPDVDRPR